MLSITRKPEEIIRLTTKQGDIITIKVKRVKGQRVTLNLDAPLTVSILRGELLEDEPATRAS